MAQSATAKDQDRPCACASVGGAVGAEPESIDESGRSPDIGSPPEDRPKTPRTRGLSILRKRSEESIPSTASKDQQDNDHFARERYRPQAKETAENKYVNDFDSETTKKT